MLLKCTGLLGVKGKEEKTIKKKGVSGRQKIGIGAAFKMFVYCKLQGKKKP